MSTELHPSSTGDDNTQPERWDCGMTDNALGGHRITALADAASLQHHGESLGLPLGSYAWRCVEEGLRLFRFEGPGDWIVVLAPSGTRWEVDEILTPRQRTPTKSIEDLAEAWSLLYAGVLPPSGLQLQSDEEIEDDSDSDMEDEPDEDNEDEDEDGRPLCPICRSADDCDHHVATIEIDEGICGGALDIDREDAAKAIELRLAEAVLAARPDPDWDYELLALYQSLHEDLADIPGLTIAAPPAGDEYEADEDTGPLPPDDLVDSDEWRDAWCRADGDAAVRSHLQAWLGNQPDVHERSYEIAHSPGLTWAGRSYYAQDAKDVAHRFNQTFLGQPARKEAP